MSWAGSTLYGISGGIWEIDTVTANVTLVSDPGFYSYSLAYDGNVLYAGSYYSEDKKLYSINPSDWSTNLIATVDYKIQAMEYYNGVLYGGDFDGNLFIINKNTGDTNLIGTGTYGIGSLAVVNDMMYGMYGGKFFNIDINTGQHTLIKDNLPYGASGMTSITPPVIPEPISSILFVTGGATLAIRRYLKRKKSA